jgi:hypothetical protein
LRLHLLHHRGGKFFQFGIVYRIEIRGGDVGLEIAVGFGDGGGGQFLRFIVASGAPAYIMRVAEGVDVYYVYVGWGKEEVLYRLGFC